MTDERFDSFLRGLQRAEQFRNNQKRAKMIQGKNWKVFQGSNLDVLPTLEDNSIDAIVTDPPYELGFMGKKWDSSGIAYNVELWRECLRVLKPGGHLLSFGGSRTWHRIAVAIEDAGFEVRDSIAWMYGSGFPKSLDISKAIDKGTGENSKRQLQFTSWMRNSGLSASKARDVLFEAGLITEKSDQASHYFAQTMGSQPAIATAEMFDALRPHLPEVPEEIERLVAERTGIEWTAYKNREVIGSSKGMNGSGWGNVGHGLGTTDIKITAPTTPQAQQWQGWGTALKPAFEPVIVARKPLIGTVAENVLTYGTGGLNIDGSRIKFQSESDKSSAKPQGKTLKHKGWDSQSWLEETKPPSDLGRWPANIILDPYTAELLDEQSGESGTTTTKTGQYHSRSEFGGGQINIRHNDSGGASRFFYVAKASKRDRNEGLEELEGRHVGTYAQDEWSRQNMGNTPDSQRKPVANFHPTVKPTTLMEYLIKLVTPPGGVVLDPFTGSGSTGKAAILQGFDFIGIELTEEYLPIIEGRLKWAEEQRNLAEAKKDEALF